MLLGIDIGGTKIAIVLGSDGGEILARREFPTCAPQQAHTLILQHTRELLASRGGELKACGLSVPGPMSSSRGMLLDPPNMPLWRDVPVKKWLEDAYHVPTAIENDANAGALAEWRWGFDRKVDTILYLTCGTGMGAGFVLDGKLYRGKQDLAGEIGHVRLRPLGPVGFYKAGSVEGLTSAASLGRLAALRREEPHASSVLDTLSIEALSGKAVGDAALAGDPFACALVRESAAYLGEFCAVLIDILNPQRISLGSLAVRLGTLYIDGVRAAAQREALPSAFESCIIDAAALGDRVQDLAALAVASSAV